MSLTENIRKDMFDATKVGNTTESDILKLVLADIKNEEISLGEVLSDEEVLKILRRQKKRIEDSISQFGKMGRNDLVEKETVQLKIIEKYLPALMNEEDITNIVKKVISETNATSIKDMGMVMGTTMKELNGKADGNTVRNIVQNLLS